MKLAAIDLGSNSIHMVIVDVQRSGAMRVVDRESEMVRLGAGALVTGMLEESSMERALQVLGAYRRLAKVHGVERILAIGTSAIREAANGEEFLDRVREKAGITAKAISGEDEARLIYLAVRQSTNLRGRRALVIDIGGGSLELALGRGAEPEFAASAKLGALRMTERFLSEDPPDPHDVRRLARYAKRTLRPIEARLASRPPTVVVGTSGTILALGRLAWSAEHGRPPEAVHHLRVKTHAIRRIVARLREMPLGERKQIPGLDSRRADILTAGGIVLTSVLDLVGAKNLVLSDWALREGVLIDYLQRNRKAVARSLEIPDIRRRSVLDLAQRCNHDEAHTRQVSRLALTLFDRLRTRHPMGAAERELLEYAALLHDIGHHISKDDHHKHSYYLIKNGGLRGFEPVEIEIIANVARYHRRGLPRKKHAGFASLTPRNRAVVELLGGILRLGDGLDRTHRQRISAITTTTRNGTLHVVCRTAGDAELELWGAAKRTDLLQKAFGLGAAVRAESRSGKRVAARRAKSRRRKPDAARQAKTRSGKRKTARLTMTRSDKRVAARRAVRARR